MDYQLLLNNLSLKAEEQEGCLVWTRSKDKDGYGKTYAMGKYWRAHRLAYFYYHGSLDSDLVVCHTCDNPPCINPRHLFVGTVAENNADKVGKGRDRGPNRNKTHCKRGHEFTPENTDSIKSGRRCKACRKIRRN